MIEMVGLTLSVTAWKLVKKGCIAYLVVVKDLNQPLLEFKNVLILKEVLSVFLEELTKLPLDRKIEFTIDLILRIESISITPY